MAAAANTNAATAAACAESLPDASGRRFFQGWAPSARRSAISFIRYTALDIRMNAPAAIALRSTATGDPKLADEINGTNTSAFLIHWRGRQAASSGVTNAPAACPGK